MRSLWIGLGLGWTCTALGLAWVSLQALGHEPRQPRPWIEIHPHLSQDGHWLVMEACRDTLPARVFDRQAPGRVTDVWKVNLDSGEALCVTAKANGSSYEPRLDGTGRRLVFASQADNLYDDRNGCADVFLYEKERFQWIRPAVREAGWCSSGVPEISPDGHYIAYLTYGNYDSGDRGRSLMLWNCETNRREEPRAGCGPALGRPAFDSDGRFVFFSSYATDFLKGDRNLDNDLFCFRVEGRRLVRRLTLAPGGEPDGACTSPVVGGTTLAMVSLADNLVPGDTNRCHDIFLTRWSDSGPVAAWRRLTAPGGAQGDDMTCEPALSRDGRFLAFTTYASNFSPGDHNSTSDVYWTDLQTGEMVRVSQASMASYNPTISGDGQKVAFVSLHDRQVYLWEHSTLSLRRIRLE